MRKALFLIVGLFIVGTLGVGTANAAAVRAGCLTIAPHVKLNFGANNPVVYSQSGGFNYMTYPCYRFVTDVVVTPASSENEFTLGWRFADPSVLPLSQSECANFKASFSIYKRTFLGSAFTLVGGGSMHGEWLGNSFPICVFAHNPGWVALPDTFDPSPWFTTTYRLVIGAKVGTWKPVRAEARHVPAP
jgi:hypothetical protein